MIVEQHYYEGAGGKAQVEMGDILFAVMQLETVAEWKSSP